MVNDLYIKRNKVMHFAQLRCCQTFFTTSFKSNEVQTETCTELNIDEIPSTKIIQYRNFKKVCHDVDDQCGAWEIITLLF